VWVKATLERELKLRPGVRFRGLTLTGRPICERTLLSTYHDTDDLRLAASSVTLRRRETYGETAVRQVKLGRGSDRLELEWDESDPRVPDEVARLLTAHTRGRPLHPVATLRTRRTGVVAHEHGVDVAEVTHDVVEVIEDGRTLRSFEEIEAELVDGGPGDLRKLEKALRRAGAADPDGRPKLFQALDLDATDSGETSNAAAGPLDAALREQYHEILEHDPGTRMGNDPAELHDHRVAVRRLRAMLRAGRPLLDRQWADDLRRSLRQAGRALADVRNLDVLAAAEALTEPWYISLLNRLEQAVAKPRYQGDGSLADAARKEHRRAAKLVRKLPRQPLDTQLHEVCNAVKRSRYAAELAAAAGTSGMRK
jgi:inorganic triphosphatase YgiF